MPTATPYNDSLERKYEKRRRTAEPAEQHRELLPVRQNDGSLKRQRVKLSKKEVEKKRRQEEARAKASGQAGGSDEEEAEPAAASSKGPSAAALREIAKQEENSAMTVEGKKIEVARLAQRLLEAPHKNVKMLRQLHDFASRDRSAMVQRLALLSMVAVLRDVLPAYRIRLPTEKELKMQVSKDVSDLREYEKTLLRAYDDCLGTLGRWLKGRHEAQRAAAVRGACALLVKARDFNSREVLVDLVVPVCNWGAEFEPQRDAACVALVELFAEDEKGDATLLAVRAMANLFKEKSFNVRPELLRTWLQLKLDAAVAVGGAADGGASGAGKRAKKRKRTLDPVAKELAQAAGERGDKGLMQGQVLELVFVSYARLIKKAPQSPLMPLVLKGIAKFAHQVNVSLLLDLVSNLRLMLRQDSAMSTETALHCVHATMRVLSGHGQALSVDQKDLQLRLFQALNEPEVFADPAMLATALDCLEHLCQNRSALLAARTASFVRRLLQMALAAPHGHAVALLCACGRLILACPRLGTMLAADEGFGRAAPAATEQEDPDSPLALQSTAWHLALLTRHHHPTVAEVANCLAHQQPLPPHLARATPLYLMASYSDAEGAFKPAPAAPKPRPKQAAAVAGEATQTATAPRKTRAPPPCSIDGVQTIVAAANTPCQVGADFAAALLE